MDNIVYEFSNIFKPFSALYGSVLNGFCLIADSSSGSIRYIFESVASICSGLQKTNSWSFELICTQIQQGFSKIFEYVLSPVAYGCSAAVKVIPMFSSAIYENLLSGFTYLSNNICSPFINIYQILEKCFNPMFSLFSSVISILHIPTEYLKNAFETTTQVNDVQISYQTVEDKPEKVLPNKIVTPPKTVGENLVVTENHVKNDFDSKTITDHIIRELNKKIESSILTEDDVKLLISKELNLINFKIDQQSKLIEDHKSLITTLISSLNDIKSIQKLEINNYIHAEIQKIYQTQQESAQSKEIVIDNDQLNRVQNELNLVKESLKKMNADRTGMPDFALEPSGGQVISTRCTESYNAKTAVISIFGVPLWYPSNTPRVVINQGVVPGECWAFQGFPGFLVVKLSAKVKIHTFSLEHIPKEISPTGHIDSSPQNFSVWGLMNETERNPLKLGQYTYDDNGDALQYFPVQAIDPPSFEMIELRIESNHGNIKFTCLYRFRVHGSIVNDTPPPP